MSDINEKLVKACKKGNINIVVDLIKNGANPMFKGGQPIKNAVMYGHINLLMLFRQKGFSLSFNRQDLLLTAISCDNLGIVKYLLDNGCNIETKAYRSLYFAGKSKDLRILKYLLDKYNFSDFTLNSVIYSFLINEKYSAINLILQKGFIIENTNVFYKILEKR